MVTWLRWWRIQTAAHLMIAGVLTLSAIIAWVLIGSVWLPWLQCAGVAANLVFWRIARREYRRELEADAWRRFRESPQYRDYVAAMRRVQETIGRSVAGPLTKMADQLRKISDGLK